MLIEIPIGSKLRIRQLFAPGGTRSRSVRQKESALAIYGQALANLPHAVSDSDDRPPTEPLPRPDMPLSANPRSRSYRDLEESVA